MNIPVFNCIINEDINDSTGVFAMSFVSDPANDTDFVALSKEKVYLNKDIKKQVLTGVVLKPEQLIYRNSTTLGEHYIKFSAEQIEKISRKMIIQGIALFNTIHEHCTSLEGNYLTEMWIVEDPQNDKSNALGFKDLPKGTLMCSYKVEDVNYWNNEVMSGNVKGFSLEGYFVQEPEIQMSKLLIPNKMKKKRFSFNAVQKAVLSAVLPKQMLSDIESVESDDITDSGETFREFTLADGKTVLVDTDGFATMDGEQMPAGEHPLADGNILVIDENGNFVETKAASAETTDPEEATAAQTLHKQAKAKARAKQQDEETLATITALSGAVTELSKAVEELKKKTPSAQPAHPKKEQLQEPPKDFSKMSTSDRMAVALSQTIANRKK